MIYSKNCYYFLIFLYFNYGYGFLTPSSTITPPESIIPSGTPSPSTSSPTILPICGSNIPTDSISGFPRPPGHSPHLRLRYQPTHIGILPDKGYKAQLVLTENGTLPTPFPTATVPPEGPLSIEYPTEDPSNTPIFCSIKLEACPSCLIKLEFESPNWHFSEYEIEKISKCDESTLDDRPCFDLEIVEERAEQSIPYLATLSGASDVYSRTSLWGPSSEKRVKTTGNSVLVVVALRNIEGNPQLLTYLNNLFPINVVVYDNSDIIRGQPSESIFMANQTSVGFIESPRFPEAYPRSIIKNYTLINKNPNGFVRLVFDDFHVHFQSELKIIDSDGSELFNTRSEYRRPPALMSRSNKLTVIFMGHDFTQLVGFRARYEFVESLDWPDKPTRRNCDEYLENYGGQISLNNQKTLLNKNIDCIWLIGRFPALSRTFDKIYLKIEEFSLKGVGLRLEVRRGGSSTAERVLLLFDEQSPVQLERKQPLEGLLTEDHIQPAFYVRLRGYLTVNTGLSMVYTQFYRWATALCPGGDGEFHCDNSKCIKSSLQCDGYDHCGDASDEVCHLPDISFEPPKIDVAGILTLVIGAAGVIVLLLTMLAILSKLYRHGYFGGRRARASAIQTAATTSASGAMAQEAFCNELAPSIQTIGERRFYILPENQLSIIEAPPTYDAALKHPRVPEDNRRSRSAMAYVYTNEGFTRASQDALNQEVPHSPSPPPPFEATPSQQPLSPCQRQRQKRQTSSISTRSQSNPPISSQPPTRPSSSSPPHSPPPPRPSSSSRPRSAQSPDISPRDSSTIASPRPSSQVSTFSSTQATPRSETSRSSHLGDDESWV